MIARYLKRLPQKVEIIRQEALVVGTGLSGLVSALNIAKSAQEVLILTKGQIKESNTQHAQGGIAAAIDSKDSLKDHLVDTLKAGVGLSNQAGVEILVKEGQHLIEELIEAGFNFDQAGGSLELAREGAHSFNRVLHAGGDATGAELSSYFINKVQNNKQIKINDQVFVLDLLTKDKIAYGLTAYDIANDCYKIYLSKVVILASGGAGCLYQTTSNPQLATGDGIALAYRAGAKLMDLEFFQFHPTVLKEDNFLISEALRGEGAKLRDLNGIRFMSKYHKLAELAARDIVARSIYKEIQLSNKDYLYLDFTEQSESFIKQRFPTIYNKLLESGFDLAQDYIPIKPAAHYFMGGIKTDFNGETDIKRLFACGETACLGIHGANRLASNSLLEALVYARRAGVKASSYLKDQSSYLDQSSLESLLNRRSSLTDKKAEVDIAASRKKLQNLMEEKVGLFRSQTGLKSALKELQGALKFLKYDFNSPSGFELQNLITLAYLISKACLIREESRGAHYRIDFPTSKESFKKHILLSRDKDWEGLEVDFS